MTKGWETLDLNGKQGMLLTLTVEDLSAALRDEPIGQLSIPLLQVA